MFLCQASAAFSTRSAEFPVPCLFGQERSAYILCPCTFEGTNSTADTLISEDHNPSFQLGSWE